jgi:hypothetical protein
MSLLRDSLDFLQREISAAQLDEISAVERVRDRSRSLRMYSTEEPRVIEPTNTQLTEHRDDSDSHSVRPNEMNFASQTPAGALPPIPSIPGVDEDVLRNLLMSWFYAGYYTAKAEAKVTSDSFS